MSKEERLDPDLEAYNLDAIKRSAYRFSDRFGLDIVVDGPTSPLFRRAVLRARTVPAFDAVWFCPREHARGLALCGVCVPEIQRATRPCGHIGRSALTLSDITTLLNEQPPPKGACRAQAQLAHQSVQAYGYRKALTPRMALDADLLLGQRRMIEGIVESLCGQAHRWRDPSR